ncbi:hypothetical protein [Streptomyces lavendulae]|uniref:hypothetical protein n=1 Tax=Streptomyces lavendulae TaxID=1914 RepID=UPI0038059598
MPGTEVPAQARLLLDGAVGDRFWLRRTLLVMPSGEAVSDNTVVTRQGADPCVDAAVADRSRPIGPALSGAGLVGLRRVVRAGTAQWWREGSATVTCASKTYVLPTLRDGAPALYVRERFHPAYVPAATEPAGGPPVGTPRP